MRRVVAAVVLAVCLALGVGSPPAHAERVSWHPAATIPTAHWPRGVTGVQGVQWYARGRAGKDRWVVSRYRGGDTVLHLYGDGRLLSTMTLHNAGHPSQFALRFDGANDTLKILVRWGSRARWVVWNGRTRHLGGARIRRQPTPGITNAHVALSGDRRWLVARKQRADGREEYRTYRRSPGRLAPVGHWVRRKPTTHQGFATDGRYVYVLYGSTGGRAFVDRMTVRGRRAGRLDVTRFHVRRLATREPEGLGWRRGRLLMSNREGGANRRRVVTVGALRVPRWGLR